MRALLRNVLVVGLFLAACGYVFTEMVLTLVSPLVSMRALVFVLTVLICWLLLDNIIIAYDLAHAAQDTSTDGERHLLRCLSLSNRKCALVHSLLEDEIAAHREIARQLDRLQSVNLTALRWSVLASKTIVAYNVRKMRRPLVRSFSCGWN